MFKRITNAEKMRGGVKPGGMSPVEDMETGGASYFFTRIKKQKSTSAGFYFKKQMLRRMDAVSYGEDKYGRVTGDFVRENRGTTPTEWKRFAGSTSNETIFKYSVTLLDNIETIKTRNRAERDRVLKAFKKHGIEKLPDGRKIEEVIK